MSCIVGDKKTAPPVKAEPFKAFGASKSLVASKPLRRLLIYFDR
jgi:hypothetical protein